MVINSTWRDNKTNPIAVGIRTKNCRYDPTIFRPSIICGFTKLENATRIKNNGNVYKVLKRFSNANDSENIRVGLLAGLKKIR